MSEKHNSQTFTKQNLYKLKKSNGGTGKNNIKFPNSFELKLPEDIKSLEQYSCNICEKIILVNDYDNHMKENHRFCLTITSN